MFDNIHNQLPFFKILAETPADLNSNSSLDALTMASARCIVMSPLTTVMVTFLVRWICVHQNSKTEV